MSYSTKGGTKSESFLNLTLMTLQPLSTPPLILPHLPLSLPLLCHPTLVSSVPFVFPFPTMTHDTTFPPTVPVPTLLMLRSPSQRLMMKPWPVPMLSSGSQLVKMKCELGSNLTFMTLSLGPKDERSLAASGFFVSSEAQMELSKSTSLDSLPKASHKLKGSTLIRLLLPLPSSPLYAPYPPLLPNTIWKFTKWISRPLTLMPTWTKKST